MTAVRFRHQQISLDHGKHVKHCTHSIPEDPAMQIAIIGAGNVGKALASTLTRAGHEVTLTAADPEHATAAARETGANAAASNLDAARAADLVVLAVPAQALDEIAGEIGEELSGKVVVDVTNRPTPNPTGPATSIAEELQEKVPGAKVVKAFNTLFASRQAEPEVAGIPADAYVAADDPGAKAAVLDVVESAGFRPVDVGSLATARTLEGMAWLNIQRNMAGGSWQDAWVLVGPETASRTADERN
ncbi:MAG TPA: NADPH-dependent F420 reductase [Candidatus Limnocylindrales bacterium]|jgi:predicted dinucleotide-binding enzyme|nr:NADPH-dependent F420 reductase [Candidatus Limnocylindrales bacterium]